MQIKILSQLMGAESAEEREEQLRLMEAMINNPFMTRVWSGRWASYLYPRI